MQKYLRAAHREATTRLLCPTAPRSGFFSGSDARTSRSLSISVACSQTTDPRLPELGAHFPSGHRHHDGLSRPDLAFGNPQLLGHAEVVLHSRVTSEGRGGGQVQKQSGLGLQLSVMTGGLIEGIKRFPLLLRDHGTLLCACFGAVTLDSPGIGSCAGQSPGLCASMEAGATLSILSLLWLVESSTILGISSQEKGHQPFRDGEKNAESSSKAWAAIRHSTFCPLRSHWMSPARWSSLMW